MRPSRASTCSRRTIVAKVGGVSLGAGEVASHGASQAALRARTWNQARSSPRSTGRIDTGPDDSRTFQELRLTRCAPIRSPVVAAAELVDGVPEDRQQRLRRRHGLHRRNRAG